MMGHKQIQMLRLLGYEDTQEDGAVLEHPFLSSGKYVWKDERFDSVLANYSVRLVGAERDRIRQAIGRM